jgi:23S rRNA pseudouridine2605 synthase
MNRKTNPPVRNNRNNAKRADLARPAPRIKPGGEPVTPVRSSRQGAVGTPLNQGKRKNERTDSSGVHKALYEGQRRQGQGHVKRPDMGRLNVSRPNGGGERLQKALAQAGIGSRREMEARIISGKVEVNGKVAEIGMRTFPGDRVKVDGRLVTLRFSGKTPRVLLYHKPEGEIVSRNDPEGRPNVFDALPRLRGGRWVSVGRLDINTSGLLLFTDSGELANRMLHPSANLLREYAARVLGELTQTARENLQKGIMLEDGMAAFARLEEAGGKGANRWYRISIYEGRNREVRRLFEAFGCKVSRLIRVGYGPFQLPSRLKRGQCLELTEAEVRRLENDLA